MQNINTIPISFTIIWFLTAYNGGILSNNYFAIILKILGLALCIIFYFKKYRMLIYMIIISIFLLPITTLGLSLSSYSHMDFLGGVLCIVMLTYAHIIHHM